MTVLREAQRLPTSCARAVEPLVHDGRQYLAVPQFARDIPGQAASLHAGDSDVETLVYRREAGAFVEHQRLPAPGAEDAEAFAIGERHFLAIACLRSGHGPYSMEVESVLYEWGDDGRLAPRQRFATFAAKQWRHLQIDGRHFLALAQGIVLPQADARRAPSCLFEWNGDRFVPFQEIDSAWGYNWHFMHIDGRPLLAYADHARPSRILAWDGAAFAPLQKLPGGSGRAFCSFRAGGETWLAYAQLLGETTLLRWHGGRFEHAATLSGPGGRELCWLPGGDGGTLVQANFIQGTREAPQPMAHSLLYRWNGRGLAAGQPFASSGATDCAAFEWDGASWLALSNSLDAALRFRADTVVYRVGEADR